MQKQDLRQQVQKARDAAIQEAIDSTETPEQAAVKLGVSISTVMRFKQKTRQTKARGRK